MTRLPLLALAVGLTLTGCGLIVVPPQAALSLPEAARQFKVLRGKVLPSEEQVPNDQRLAMLGATALANGNMTRAEINLDSALVINPYNPYALFYLASLYQRTSRYREARTLYTRLIALDSDAAALTDTPAAMLGERLIHVARTNLIELGQEHRPDALPPPGPEDAERALISRFATLMRLRDQKLITKKEYAAHRRANLSALLPMTASPPTTMATLVQPAPDGEDIIVRLNAISRFKDVGALTEPEYVAERAAILDALLPARQSNIAAAPPKPPADTRPQLERLARLYSLKLITAKEHNRERAALLAKPAAEAPKPTTAAKPSGGTTKTATVTTVSPAPPKPGAPAQATLRPRKSTDASQSPKRESTSSGDDGKAIGVHIASFRTPERARRSWADLRKTHGDVLASLDSRIARVEIRDKGGVFYQLRAGPFSDETAAKALCSELKRRNVYCMPSIF